LFFSTKSFTGQTAKENQFCLIKSGLFGKLNKKGDKMGKRKRRGKLNWRSKRANHGKAPSRG
jgi:hypothetical protein